jgi:cyclophilin family peptidyl-prolyl cis-trans isomerase
MGIRCFALGLGFFLLAALRSECADSYVRFNTSLGYIDVKLLSNAAPNTVANFLSYANNTVAGSNYTNSIIHRSVPGFVVQGGGYNFVGTTLTAIPLNRDYTPVTGNPLISEAGVSNTRGTLAMALSTGPNSGTDEWFFNEVDNSSSLDRAADGGPFTVFGVIANTSSLSVMDQINNVSVFDFGAPFDSLPLFNYTTAEFQAGTNPTVNDFVFVNSITPLTVQNFPAWQTAKFTVSQQGMPAFIAPTATPWNDGVSNLLKYLCDINPSVPMTSADRAKLPTVGRVTNNGTNYVTLTYHQNTALVSVTVNVQTSTDLQTWTTLTNPIFVQTALDSAGDTIFQIHSAITGTKLFIRLRVTLP